MLLLLLLFGWGNACRSSVRVAYGAATAVAVSERTAAAATHSGSAAAFAASAAIVVAAAAPAAAAALQQMPDGSLSAQAKGDGKRAICCSAAALCFSYIRPHLQQHQQKDCIVMHRTQQQQSHSNCRGRSTI